MLIRKNYDKDQCQAGVLHIGIGAFHRSHQAYYFDCLLADGYQQWGIVGVNLRPEDQATIKKLQQRNNSYVLKTASPDQDIQYQEIQSILHTVDASQNETEAKMLLQSPDLHLITITISEAGYWLLADGRLDESSASIQSDIEEQGISTVYGYLRQVLEHRKNTNNLPITIVCCDNIINNGQVLEKAFRRFLSLCGDLELLNWLTEKVSFPRSMVDRITPKVDNSLSKEIEQLFSLQNDSSVLTESYRQWVIEDNFKGRQPPLYKYGVEIVENIEDFENLKIRVLNAGHSCLAYVAALDGYVHFDKAFNDSAIRGFFMTTQYAEILPTITGFSEQQIEHYLETIIERFSNHHISDTVERICMEGFAKVQFYLLPIIRHNLTHNKVPKNLIRSLAYWYVFIVKVFKGNLCFRYYDSNSSVLRALVEKNSMESFIKANFIWGDVALKYPVFGQLLKQNILEIDKKYQ